MAPVVDDSLAMHYFSFEVDHCENRESPENHEQISHREDQQSLNERLTVERSNSSSDCAASTSSVAGCVLSAGRCCAFWNSETTGSRAPHE